jgi:LemA protein
MTALYAVPALAILLGLWLVLAYNRLVRARNMTAEAASGVDVQLKRRADLIPNLVESVKGYAGHEKAVFGEVAALREKSLAARTPAEQSAVEAPLSRALGSLFAVAEAYPQLKASENFLALQADLAKIEEALEMARRYYNGCARNQNILVQSFPSSLIAGLFRFGEAQYFEVADAAERAAPKVFFP